MRQEIVLFLHTRVRELPPAWRRGAAGGGCGYTGDRGKVEESRAGVYIRFKRKGKKIKEVKADMNLSQERGSKRVSRRTADVGYIHWC